MTDDLVDVYERTVRATGRRVAAVRPEQLHDPTPCTEWDVLALLDHMVGGLLAYGMIAVDGRIDFRRIHAADLAARYVDVYEEAAAGAIASWRRPGVLEEPCRHPLGPMRRGDALALHHADHLLHGWDLCVATGQDAALDEPAAELAFRALTSVTPVTDALRAGGYWGAEGAVAPGSGISDRLLAFSGRVPP